MKWRSCTRADRVQPRTISPDCKILSPATFRKHQVSAQRSGTCCSLGSAGSRTGAGAPLLFMLGSPPRGALTQLRHRAACTRHLQEASSKAVRTISSTTLYRHFLVGPTRHHLCGHPASADRAGPNRQVIQAHARAQRFDGAGEPAHWRCKRQVRRDPRTVCQCHCRCVMCPTRVRLAQRSRLGQPRSQIACPPSANAA
jgi:hypothetical protein